MMDFINTIVLVVAVILWTGFFMVYIINKDE